jgi:hypothetical protein
MSRAVLILNMLLSATACALSTWALVRFNSLDSADRVITVRGLIVEDAAGQARVVLGAPVPDPVVLGKTVPRDGALSGLILIGPDGNERGGYATSDGDSGGAVLTLDANDGSEVFKVFANPNSGASLFLLHQNNAGAMLTTYRGEPELQLIDRNGVTRFAQPPKSQP